ncbi:MAG: cellulase family glycosylhydrolase [Eubacteriales bacterium]|nr:cellulase family glycosylhydrolase [Eubacteriales bacterium]
MKRQFAKIYLMGSLLLFTGMLYGCGNAKITEISENTTAISSENQREQNETEEKTTQEQEIAKTEDYTVSVKNSNSWEQDGKVCIQFEGSIQNTSSQNGKDWKVVVSVPDNTEIKDSWNGNYVIKDNQLLITPVDYNKEIVAKSEVTFGFILASPNEFEPEQVVLTMQEQTYAMQEQNKEDEKKEAEKSEQSSEVKIEKTEKKISKKEKGTPVKNHGALAVKGTDLVDQKGKAYQLKGVSTHGLAWFPDYVNKEAFASLSEYGVNAIRLAMYTAEYGGYCNGGDKEKLRALVEQGVDACTELGMYVIIDWHILSDNDPNIHKDEAKQYFDTMSKKYADNNNVIYEICNEPCNGTTWEQVKSYAEEVIPVIRKNDKNAIIIVGTPNWSQDVDIASQNPIKGYENIMYAVHFYASTHKEEIRNKVKKARENGIAVIVSECSICEASGNGTVDYQEAEKWMQMIQENNMSMFAWNLSNKDEKSSLLKSSVTAVNGFGKDDFSETGIWFMEQYSK